ncbi:MAG: type II toxin-antitoxin system VapC family toxin [Planctomycetes bacterium]|nr:type II toxin-antitoxin system VapC family toxin [Planctomycetota bacterium]
MKVVDINLLLYAVNVDAPHHARARAWWEETLSGEEPVGLAWSVVLGFLRVSTSGRVMPHPLKPDQALDLMEEWLGLPPATILLPTERHWEIFKALLLPLGMAGNLTSDAHLAALAIEHGARLYSSDNDFGRFPHLRWVNPLAA